MALIDERQQAANVRAQKEAEWFYSQDLTAKDKDILAELLRIKLMQFYSTGAMDAIDLVEERMALKSKIKE